MTACGLRIEVTDELISPRFKRTDIDGDLASAGDDLLAPELGAFELFGCWIVVLDDQRNLYPGRDLDFRWLEPVILDDEGVTRLLRRGVGSGSQDKGERNHQPTDHERFSGRQMRLTRILSGSRSLPQEIFGNSHRALLERPGSAPYSARRLWL